MAKKTFATLGFLTLLVLTLGVVNAAVDGITADIEDAISNPVTPGNSYEVSIKITNDLSDAVRVALVNSSSTYDTVWTSLDDENVTIANSENAEFNATIQIPSDYTDSHSRQLKYEVYYANNDTYIGSGYKSFTVNSTIHETEIQGCTDPNANNYDSDATEDDGSCTYDSSTTFCEKEGFDEDGNLEITDIDVKNNGEGSDDEWQYLDSLEITVDVENTGNDDIEDVEVEILILDGKIENGGNDVTNDFDFEDEVLDDIGKLKDDDEESVTFVIDELSTDAEDGTSYIYIMAYEDGNKSEQCVSEIDGDKYYSFEIESLDYEDSIVVRGSEFEEVMSTYCGQENLEIIIPIYNLGDDEEERILVNLYDSELGIDEYVVIKDIDDGDKETVTFFVDIPSDLSKDKYTLDVIVSFDWDDDEDDDDPFSYDEKDSDTEITLNVLGCSEPAPSITASLDSEMQVGENLIVKSVITNNGELSDFTITPTGYEAWADLVSVTPQQTEIAAGSSQEITIVLSPKEAGEYSFTISTVVDGEVYNQPVAVSISEEPGMFSELGLSNTALYLIAGIVILIILILLVAIIKIAKRPTKAEF